MKNDDVEKMLAGIDPPKPERITHQGELKIPLLRYRRSSRAGLSLLVLPVLAAVTYVLKRELALSSAFLDGIRGLFGAMDGNPLLSILIPVIFIGFPLTAMTVNLLAFLHFAPGTERRELVVTVKYRPANIAVFLFSFVVLVFFLMPDMMSF